jgi:outer membrane protein OmpA-like peptidoglycan-associated protein
MAWGLALALLLQACATSPGAGARTAPRPGAALVTERQWLQSWFDGTPVRIVQRGDGPVSVDVPREFCFDAGRSSVKPPLAAVLDKVAQSLRRVPGAALVLIAAPGDDAGTPRLARQRADRVRAQLLSRGAPAAQLGPASVTDAAAVQLRLEVAASR